jgi:hypothetical protein
LTVPRTISNINIVMKISELIQALKHQQNLWGDLPVIHNIGVCYEPTYEEVDDVQALEHGTIGKPPVGIEII